MINFDPEKIKAVALDMDGTLLNDSKKISSSTGNCIEILKKKSIVPILVTGRSFEALRPFKDTLKLTSPVICYNGAQVIDGLTGELLQNHLLSDSSSRFLINLAKKEDIHVQAYKNGILYFEKRRPESDHYESHVNLKGEIIDFDTISPLNFTKMMYVGKHDKLKKIQQTVIRTIGYETTVIFSNDEFLEFMHKDISKGSALLYALSLLGIKSEETIAFGDGENDIPMLETAGIGVAMGNASTEVKKAADFITLSNNEDGIVRFLGSLCKL